MKFHVLHPKAVIISTVIMNRSSFLLSSSSIFTASFSFPVVVTNFSFRDHHHFLSRGITIWSFLIFHRMEEKSFREVVAGVVENLDGKKTAIVRDEEACSTVEPFIGMEFESEEVAKSFYDNYATCMGFVMRVDAFRRSMRDGSVVWRRLVCNKEGFRRSRPRRSESRKPRAVTREGCKALIVVKRDKSAAKWVVTKFVKEHNHPLLPLVANARRSSQLSHTPDEKDAKIRELSAELSRERRRCAALQQQLDMVLMEMEQHSNHLSVNINNVIQSVREIESNTFTKPPLS
uniref:Protein FAR1-RELATED SEQUENCE 5 n=1 Tax=Noccaea caerulescens TaxID=107243 RepID=A0A1J3HXS6_NOCCA